MNEEINVSGLGMGKKGRKKKDKKLEENNEVDSQYKFFVDLRHEKEVLEQILKMLKAVNDKSYGREITFRDLAVFAVPKLTAKDLEKIQEGSLSEMERVQRLLDEHNQKNETKLTLGEFLVKKLNI
jgi:hypothetical protein